MAIEDRRRREQADRRSLITATARELAEREGWDAVTTRRLSTEIEYSQPVIYKHFASMDVLADAVALEGFGEIAEALATARRAVAAEEALGAAAHAYCAYAADNPAVYDAMFSRTTRLVFGEDSAPPLQAAFAELRSAVATVAAGRDVDTLTEVWWSALHGLSSLARHHRLRPDHRTERIDVLVAQFQAPASRPDPRGRAARSAATSRARQGQDARSSSRRRT